MGAARLDPGGGSAGWLTRLSIRQACNLIYVHLTSRLYHEEKCRAELCVSNCRWARFHADLEAPLLTWEFREHAARTRRIEALIRGEITAA